MRISFSLLIALGFFFLKPKRAIAMSIPTIMSMRAQRGLSVVAVPIAAPVISGTSEGAVELSITSFPVDSTGVVSSALVFVVPAAASSASVGILMVGLVIPTVQSLVLVFLDSMLCDWY